MKVLVTGGTGFLGSAVIRQHLDRGDEVVSLARRPLSEWESKGVTQLFADLSDAAAMQAAFAQCRGVDVVHHTAAVAGVWGPWKSYYDANVLGTEHVIAGCHAAGIKKLVFTSSPSVTFGCEPQQGIDESAPYAEKWFCHYPHTKAIAEQAVLQANGKQDLATCALRPHLIWGPGDRHLLPRVIERGRKGLLRRVGDGKNKIDTIYIDNAAAAQLLAADALSLDAPLAGRAYFLSQDEPVECWPWLDEVLALADLPPIQKSISFRAAWNAGAVLESVYTLLGKKSEPRMTRFVAAQLALDHYFDISAAKRDFGYEPKVSIAQGMEHLAEAIQREGW